MILELNVLKNNIYIMYIHYWKSFNESIEQGGYKKVFISESNPNLIIKKFSENNYIIRDNIEKLTKQYPNLFAKIYKIDYNKKILIQERLDLEGPKEDIKNYIFF
jgi:hypothetical protein